MKNVVVRNIKRADPQAIATFEKLGASTVHEALGRYQLMKPYMRPIWPGACIAGPAVTILAQPGDNWMLHVAIEQCQPGDVVVLGCTADNTDGMIGDLIATCSSPLSRNRTFGENLGRGLSVDETIAATKQTCEGVKSCQAILDLARHHGVDVPITQQVVNVVHHGMPPADMLRAFMSRETKAEGID